MVAHQLALHPDSCTLVVALCCYALLVPVGCTLVDVLWWLHPNGCTLTITPWWMFSVGDTLPKSQNQPFCVCCA
jgi:hypothetical protein